MRTSLARLLIYAITFLAISPVELAGQYRRPISVGSTVRLRLVSGETVVGRVAENPLRASDSVVTVCRTPHGACIVDPERGALVYRRSQIERLEYRVHSSRSMRATGGALVGAALGTFMWFMLAGEHALSPEALTFAVTYFIGPPTIAGALVGASQPAVDRWVLVRQ